MKIKTFLVLIVVVIIACFTVLPWGMIFLGITLMPNPPKPEITHREFPFKLVYEINGKKKVIEDTLVCEYDGIGMNEGQGKYRKWKEHLASGREKLILLKVDNPVALGIGDIVVNQEIYYDPGPANFYMGDMGEGERHEQDFPDASYFETYQDGGNSEGIIEADELLSKFHIKLISWDYTKPIKNSFLTK